MSLCRENTSSPQRGQALLLMLVILAIGFGAAFYTFVGLRSTTVERDKITAAALAQAKAALIGYAVGVSDFAGGARPGDLPCPDTNDSGAIGTSCGNAAGTTGQTTRIGRLPWKSLGLPDLRDADGERLWYAVSVNFKYNSRSACAAPGDTGCLNSDSRGTITIRNSAGTVINDGSNPDPYTPSGVIAVVFAPGAILQRQDGVAQDRSCTGGSCTAAGVCNSSPTTTTPKCNPVNYLDVLNSIEDNAGFTDGSSSDGFINGVINDASGNPIVNDRLITITYNDLMPVLQRRVAREVSNCLTDYAAVAQNNGRYPWAVPVGAYPSFGDQAGTRFGRVPDTMSDTLLGLGGGVISFVCDLLPGLCMSSNWPASCSITQGSWWTNWKDMVFYGVAEAYQPSVTASLFPLTASVPASSGCGNCLRVNPSTAINKRFVVAVAGKRLRAVNGGQPRTTTTNKQDSANYLEDENGNNTATSYIYADLPESTSFNDTLSYQ